MTIGTRRRMYKEKLTFRSLRLSRSVACFLRSMVTVFFLQALHAQSRHFLGAWPPEPDGARTWGTWSSPAILLPPDKDSSSSSSWIQCGKGQVINMYMQLNISRKLMYDGPIIFLECVLKLRIIDLIENAWEVIYFMANWNMCGIAKVDSWHLIHQRAFPII